jgi:2-polyprenyl-3-methyl-5-hydroxy-6-metoxy-1,4-benzoquinol methylase
LISRIGDEYIEYRWKRHPVSRSHYAQTLKSVEFAFNNFCGGTVENLLEIGSGPGTWTGICLRHTTNMTIIDISSEMLKLVRDRFVDIKMELHCGDFISQNIKLTKNYDLIFSARAIEYMDDKGKMVEKCSKSLSPNGILIIITKNPKWMDKQRDLRKQKKHDKNDIQKDWIYWRDMEALFSANNLVEIKTFPVCLGSYNFPLKTLIGIKFCDLIHKLIYRCKISKRFDFLLESYMTIGKKSANS